MHLGEADDASHEVQTALRDRFTDLHTAIVGQLGGPPRGGLRRARCGGAAAGKGRELAVMRDGAGVRGPHCSSGCFCDGDSGVDGVVQQNLAHDVLCVHINRDPQDAVSR